jgi:hypothetical protein
MKLALKKSKGRARTAHKKLAAKKKSSLACVVSSRMTLPKRRDRVLEKFDRGEDVFEYCDLKAGVLKIPLG